MTSPLDSLLSSLSVAVVVVRGDTDVTSSDFFPKRTFLFALASLLPFVSLLSLLSLLQLLSLLDDRECRLTAGDSSLLLLSDFDRRPIMLPNLRARLRFGDAPGSFARRCRRSGLTAELCASSLDAGDLVGLRATGRYSGTGPG